MSIEEKYELFESYSDNTMSEDDRLGFEDSLKHDTFKNEFDEYCDIQNQYKKIIENEAKEKEFIANLKKTATDFHQEKTPTVNTISNNKLSFTRNLKWISSIAAILLVGFFGYQYFGNNNQQSMQELYASNYTVEKLSVERGSPDQLFDSLTALYNSEQYAKALPGLINYRDNYHQNNNNINLAIAISQLELKDYVAAESNLQSLIVQNNVYKEKAQWYLAMLYLKQKNKTQAIELLKQFDEGHFYHKKGKEILKNLE